MNNFAATSPALRLFLAVILLLLLVACGEKANVNAESNAEVEKKADALFGAWKAGDYDTLLAQYDENFFRTHAREEWVDKLKGFIDERGPMTAWHVRRTQADTRFSGKFFLYEYETVHDGNKRLHHLMTFIWPVGEDKIKLIGHKITPWQVGEE